MKLLDELRTEGALEPLDVSFAVAMGRLAGESRPEPLAAAAFASRSISGGHVCLDLERLIRDREAAADAEVQLPPLDTWLEMLRASPLLGSEEEPGPICLDAGGRLYLRRYFEMEGRLAEELLERAARSPVSFDAALLEDGLERLFPVDPVATEPDLQRVAARMAIERSFAVISGGPGTGKTSTVVKILALLLEQSTAAGADAMRIMLLAPTGKAGARLEASILKARDSLSSAPEVVRAIPVEAQTIHRALGARPDRPGRHRHHAGNPLPADLVLVDEASMVDLALMASLFDALYPETRVLLLGDKHQLASVEAGAVLGDICGEGASPPPIESSFAGSIVHLEKSWRYGEGSGIAELARAINAGDAARAVEVLSSGAFADVSLVPPPGDGSAGEALIREAVLGHRVYLGEESIDARTRALSHHGVLCAHRRGLRGVDGLNEAIARALYAEGLIPRFEGHHEGRLVMIRRNDPQLRLSNGDVGHTVVGEGGRLEVVFGEGSEARSFAVSRLPPHQSVYAMTIHKSQGSEFDSVSVVLPDAPSPILSRELLYTAVTRAAKSVRIHGAPEVLERAVATRIERSSGLGARLWSRG